MPADSAGEERATKLLKEQFEIVKRQEQVQSAFASQAVELQHELENDFYVRLVFESNAIEGIATTFRETQEFLRTAEGDLISKFSFVQGVDADPKLLEVVGHGGALKFVKELALALGGRPLREIDIRNIHKLAMAVEPTIAGHYKTMDNAISGRDKYLTARADDVSWHVCQLVEWLEHSVARRSNDTAVVSAW